MRLEKSAHVRQDLAKAAYNREIFEFVLPAAGKGVLRNGDLLFV